MISDLEKIKIISYYVEGKNGYQISKLTNISTGSIYPLLRKYDISKTFKRKSGSGRKPSLSSYDKEKLSSLLSAQPDISAEEMKTNLKKLSGKDVCSETIRNYLKNSGYFSGKYIKKPLLSKKHQAKRKEICERWTYKGSRYWKDVLFSDETKFELFNPTNKKKIWKKKGDSLDPKYIKHTVKYGGGNVMFWGCFSYEGVGNLVVIDGKMDKYQYVSILADNLSDSADKLKMESFIFQQDNDPKHTSKYTKAYFEATGLEIVEQPSQSPDLNPIEHLWAYIKSKLCGKSYKKKEELIAEVERIWFSTPVDVCRKLIDSMKSRIKHCLKNNGGHTKY